MIETFIIPLQMVPEEKLANRYTVDQLIEILQEMNFIKYGRKSCVPPSNQLLAEEQIIFPVQLAL